MNRRALVLTTAGATALAFLVAGILYTWHTQNTASVAVVESNQLVRPHSPIIGPAKAPVTIVEFFDPACESCRAFHPHVKQILAQHPDDVRLVMRYAPFHKGSDEAVKIIETARLQKKFIPVLEALLETQPTWADHGRPDLAKAWAAAGAAGLDLDRARKDATLPRFDELLRQDIADLKAVGVKGTPTFFVNGKPLTSFGPAQLAALVEEEVKAARKLLAR